MTSQAAGTAPSSPGSAAGGSTERVLWAEDDEVIGEAITLHLQRHGYQVSWVVDGLEALESFTAAATDPGATPFTAVLCDIMLPGLDGISLCRRIRERDTTPVLLVSARSDSIDVIAGLEAGADDYVTKPFDVQVLLARLRSVTRRAGPPTREPPDASDPDPGREQFGDLELDRGALQVSRAGRPVSLTPTEMRLLLTLADARGAVVPRSRLLEGLWEQAVGWSDEDHLVTVNVQRLRSKIGAEHVETVRGFGYKLSW